MSPTTHPLLGRAPDDPVFLAPGRVVTARHLLGAARRVADRLGSAPVGAAASGAASFVVNACRDRACFAAAFLGAVLAGRTTLQAGDRSPAGLRALRESYGALVIAADGADAPEGFPVVPVSVEAGDDGMPFDVPEIESERLVALVFTSGSTGRPVAHEKRWGALVDRTVAGDRVFGLGAPRRSTVVGTVPPEHMYGFETTVLMPLHAAVLSWTGSSFYPEDIRAALAAAEGPRVLVTTPLHLRALLRAGLDLPPLDGVISATAPLDLNLAEAVERRWCTTVREIFGATEVGSIASRRTAGSDAWRLYPGVRMELSDPDAPPVIHAAFSHPHPLSDVVERDGPDGFRLLGRVTDIVKVGGRRASLAGLNQVLLAIPGVQDGAFVLPPDREGEPATRLAVFVVAPGLTAANILAGLRERVEGVFLPRRIAFVDALPRDAVGKLPREAQLALLRGSGPEEGSGRFTVPASHPGLPGHFPGNPIVPGVVLLAEMLGVAGVSEAVTSLDTVKFVRPVRPGEEVSVRWTRAAPDRLTVSGSVGEHVVVEGRVRLSPA